MNKIIHRLTLDTHKNGIQRVLQGFYTGESGSRQIIISLVTGSEPYIIPKNGVTPVMMVVANGITSLNACNIDGNTIVYDIEPNDIAMAGTVEMQLKLLATSLTGNEMVLISPKFQLEVWESSSSSGDIESNPTYTALEAALVKAEQYGAKTIKSIEIDDDNMIIITYMDDSYQAFDTIAKAIELVGNVEQYIEESKTARDEAVASAGAALLSETSARVSEANAKTSEDNASTSEVNALSYMTTALASADSASVSESNAKASENVALDCKTVCETDASICVSSASSASASESKAILSETNAKASETNASTSEVNAFSYSTISKSYAVGGTGTRTGEDNDNARYYLEQCQQVAGSLSGGFVPMGTVVFANLPTNASAGWMYNISDAFTSDSRFKDGAGITYAAGANIYLTADGLWDVLTYGVPTVNGHQGLVITVDGSDIALTGYNKAATESAIAVTDTVNVAIGKLEKKSDEVGNKITTAIGSLPSDVSTLQSNLESLQTEVTNSKSIISGTLATGETSITLTDARITADSIIEPYQYVGAVATSIIAPLTISVDAGVCTMTFDEQTVDVIVGIRVV